MLVLTHIIHYYSSKSLPEYMMWWAPVLYPYKENFYTPFPRLPPLLCYLLSWEILRETTLFSQQRAHFQTYSSDYTFDFPVGVSSPWLYDFTRDGKLQLKQTCQCPLVLPLGKEYTFEKQVFFRFVSRWWWVWRHWVEVSQVSNTLLALHFPEEGLVSYRTKMTSDMSRPLH